MGAVIAIAAVAVTLGGWLAFTAPGPSPAATTPTPPRPAPQIEEPARTGLTLTAPLEPLPATSDPEDFATAVARALFDWDTRLSIRLSDHTGRLLALADPTGAETPGLAADIAAYLPTRESWAFLTRYYTRQWIEISSIAVPDLWARALAEAGPHGLAPGTTAYTIRGTRHRAGRWEGEHVTSTHQVEFTIFMVCEPSYPTCHLLRLSRLNEPLE